ncbi:MAG: alpha-L-fucosidase [Phycisphaeraceae bacterium]|nr:alpha-L-fucosidase [Phycisphaeraceae bacterium]
MPIQLILAALTLTPPPAPVGALPTEAQIRWHEREFYGFIHFTTNTFTDKEWGYGDESPDIFNPSALDTNQWARVAHDAGMTGLILTAKHHDGFCLWPTAHTSHSVKSSAWRGGRGDVVGDLAKSCRVHGLGFGVYLSPWDRNHPTYATPAYVDVYRAQLAELIETYGPVFKVWHDGANGGDGYYGGARETRTIDKATYYDWPDTWAMIQRLAPDAIVFSDVGPGCRWVGNEHGFSAETSWQTISPGNLMPGMDIKGLDTGDPDGTHWIGVEADVSIRPGWFYHASEDDKVKTPEQLLEIWYGSIGRGANLLLNIPPDRRGLIHENDIASLTEFRRILDATFEEDLLRGSFIGSQSVRSADDARFAPANLLDNDPETYWATPDGITAAAVEVTLPERRTIDVIKLREHIRLGQRIESFAVDYWAGGQWIEFAQGTTIGPRRILRTERITTDRLRLRITGCRGDAIVLADFSAYCRP